VNGSTIYLTTSVSTSVWYHIAWTWDGKTHRLFKDGTLVDSATNVPSLYLGTNTGIGGQSTLSDYDLDGRIEDFRITQGKARYTEDFTVPSANFDVDTTSDGGGLVWLKDRDSANSNTLYDTERGGNKVVNSNNDTAEATESGSNGVSFNSNGFKITGSANQSNASGNAIASWSFKKQAKFFDCVTYTGDGTGTQNISHNLGVIPGCIVVKRLDTVENWFVWHRSFSTYNDQMNLDSGAALGTTSFRFGVVGSSLDINSSTFTVGGGSFGALDLNQNNATYVAYLWAHDPHEDFAEDLDEYYANGSNISGFNGSGEYRIYTNATSVTTAYNAGSDSGSVSGLNNFSGIIAKIETDTGQKVRVGPQQSVSGSVTFYSIIAQEAASGTTNNDGFIACGQYIGGGWDYPQKVTLGWEPQWVLLKKVESSGNWRVLDMMRGSANGYGNSLTNASKHEDAYLTPSTTTSEADGVFIKTLDPDGFTVAGNNSAVDGAKYVYIAIRRSMKQPTSSTEVFDVTEVPAADATSGLVAPNNLLYTDMALMRHRTNISAAWIADRLRRYMYNFVDTGAESYDSAKTNILFDENYGVGPWFSASQDLMVYSFKRAKSFFDVVTYDGTGAVREVAHQLGVAPEMIIIRRRDNTGFWPVYHSGLNDGVTPEQWRIIFNETGSESDQSNHWNDTAPTSTHFTLGSKSQLNNASGSYVAYLFASLENVSAVGNYTGTGADGNNIDCGFSAGARFVLIKRTDSDDNWMVFDTQRGIVAGNDPFLRLDTNSSEVTGFDLVDPNSSGFTVNNNVTVNASGGSYIFYAISV
jgi:hypothetical protein